jgi:hypothetical protein
MSGRYLLNRRAGFSRGGHESKFLKNNPVVTKLD